MSLVVTNTSERTTEKDLKRLFEENYGSVKRVLRKDKGFVVEFERKDDAEHAAYLDTMFQGKNIVIKLQKAAGLSKENRNKIITKMKEAIEKSEIPINPEYGGKIVYNELSEYAEDDFYKIEFDQIYDPNKKIGKVFINHGNTNSGQTITNKEQILDIITNDAYYAQKIGQHMNGFVLENNGFFLEFSTYVVLKYTYQSLGNNAKVLREDKDNSKDNVNMLIINIGFFFVMYNDEEYYQLNGVGYKKLRLQQLCSKDSRFKKDELYEWATELAIKSHDEITICRRITRHIQDDVNRSVKGFISRSFNWDKLYADPDTDEESLY